MNEDYHLPSTISVAISYSRGSHKEYREAIINIIENFRKKRVYKVSVYIDRRNITGDQFESVIDENFRNADIIICLVTNDFLKNGYVRKNEKPIIQDFHNRKEKEIIPIIISRTDDYENSWMGELKITTLPTEEAPRKPYSSYSNREYANSQIEKGLDQAFTRFHDVVVIPRIKGQIIGSDNKKSPLILFIIFIFGLFFLFFWNESSIQRPPSEEKKKRPPEVNRTPSDIIPELIEDIKPDILNEKPVEKDPDLPNSPSGYDNENSLIATICNSKSSMEMMFPRVLSSYPYFGKEIYGKYESCQGKNVDGYKPCKRNRRWYIVNEEKNQHLMLKLDDETHKDIYAIRPLFNNVAEVYFYDGKSMYLAFCVSLEDGEEVE